MNYFTKILLFFILIYFFIIIFTYFFQRSLLYHPTENNYSEDKILVSIEKVFIKTNDNLELLAWYKNNNLSKYKTVLFLHGNAGTLENRIHKINHFKKINVNFLLVAWRGFSGNKGKPTEKGLYEDARSAVKWLEEKGIKKNNIILYGESLGTGIVTEIAQNENFAGIILESPFTSMIAAGKDKYPFLPVKILLKDKNFVSSLIYNVASIYTLNLKQINNGKAKKSSKNGIQKLI